MPLLSALPHAPVHVERRSLQNAFHQGGQEGADCQVFGHGIRAEVDSAERLVSPFGQHDPGAS